MSQTVAKSFRLPESVIEKLLYWSNKENLTQGQFLEKIIDAYEMFQLQQQFLVDSRKAAKDEEYLSFEQELAAESYE